MSLTNDQRPYIEQRSSFEQQPSTLSSQLQCQRSEEPRNSSECHHKPSNQQPVQSFARRQSQNTFEFACLYSKHKTQKRKVWQDGRLAFHGCRVALYDANPPPGAGDPVLDETEITTIQSQSLRELHETRLETDKYVVQVEGPWLGTTNLPRRPTAPRLVSNGMKNVLTKKFRRPSAYVPPRQRPVPPAKRRYRPLQPGDLYQRHYGVQPPPVPSAEQEQEQQQSLPRSWTNSAHLPTQGVPQVVMESSRRPPSQQQASAHSMSQDLPPSVNPAFAPRSANTPAAPCFQQGPAHGQCPDSEKENNLSSNNGFNPSSFYGEEEEDTGSVDNAPDAFDWNQPLSPQQNHNQEHSAHPAADHHSPLEDNPPRATNPIPHPTTTIGATSGPTTVQGEQRTTLSSTQLLALFAVGPGTVASEDGENNTSSQPDAAALTTTSIRPTTAGEPSTFRLSLPCADEDSSSDDEFE